MADKYEQAMAEAVASVSGDGIILHTLEFRHSAFRDESGNLTAARIVRDTMDCTAPLEDDAPLQAGVWVTFRGVPFRFKPPPEEPAANPEVTIEVDNIARYIEPYLELGANSEEAVLVTYRPYLSDALADGCQIAEPYTLVVTNVVSNMTTVTITAKMEDVTNKAFLWENITSQMAPTLVQ